MFKEKIIKEFEAIKPSEQTENAVLLKMEQEQEKQISAIPKKPAKKRWIAAVAAVLAVVIVLVTVFNMPIFNGSNFISNIGSNGEDTLGNSSNDTASADDTASEDNSIQAPLKGTVPNTTYDEVYKLFEEIDAKRNEQSGHYNDTEGTSSRLSDNKGGSSNNSNGNSNPSTPSKSYTKTNVQVEGVDEGDIVKTDGEYIYYLNSSHKHIYVAKANDGKLTKTAVASTSASPYRDFYGYGYNDYEAKDLYLCGDTLVLILSADRTTKAYKGECTLAMLFDVSNPKAPKYKKEYVQTGHYVSSRLIGDKLYVFSTDITYTSERVELPDGNYEYKKVWRLPQLGSNNKVLKPIDEKNLYVFDGEVDLEYFLAVSIDLTSEKRIDSKAVIGGGSNVYVNSTSIYAVSNEVNYFNTEGEYVPRTYIIKFSIYNGEILPIAKSNLKGTLINQFLMDEYNGYFRIITTTRKYRRNPCCSFFSIIGVESNTVYVLDKNLKTVGTVTGIARNEAVTSSRFMGEIGYFCTSPLNVNADPFFAVDFSNPQKPKILDSLEFPGVADYLHPYGNGLMLGIGETGSGEKIKLIMFDISNPKNIREIASKDTNIPYPVLYGFNSSKGHKMVNIIKEKNIICFPDDDNYNIFTFSRKNGFEVYGGKSYPTQTDKNGYFGDGYLTRGIFIDSYLYVCNENGIISYLPSKNSKKISEIDFSEMYLNF